MSDLHSPPTDRINASTSWSDARPESAAVCLAAAAPSEDCRPMLVSIVVPTHHRPGMLRDLLASLERQSYPLSSLEVNLVASPDDPAFAVAEEFRMRGRLTLSCTCIPDDPWQGRNPAAKRNYGVEQARGEWIAFIDDDCLADPEWISAAAALLADPTVMAVEGAKMIPQVDPPTLTYKGLLSFTRPGGYQTCNMFYRRNLFLRLGGFDLRFPFYLEDSDLAWTVLDEQHPIPYAAKARVYHPVSEPAPWRLLDDAKRTILLPLLRRKHRAQYRSSGMRAVRSSHAVYLVAHLVLLGTLLAGAWTAAMASVGLIVLLTLLDLARLFRGCRVRRHEVAVTAILLPVVPVVRLVQFLRGVWRYRVVQEGTR
jgi:Glycosyl transferase family 2